MGARTIRINGRVVELPAGPVTVAALRERAGVAADRAIAAVDNRGTMRRIAERDVVRPADTVFAELPDFGYGA